MRVERFENRVVVVTGAAQGIGRAVALQMAAEKACLLLVDRSEIVKEVAEEALAAGAANVQTSIVDLELYAGACKAVDSAVSHFGRIDILVNNVGGTIWVQPMKSTRKNRSKPRFVAPCFRPFGVPMQSWRRCKNSKVE